MAAQRHVGRMAMHPPMRQHLHLIRRQALRLVHRGRITIVQRRHLRAAQTHGPARLIKAHQNPGAVFTRRHHRPEARPRQPMPRQSLRQHHPLPHGNLPPHARAFGLPVHARIGPGDHAKHLRFAQKTARHPFPPDRRVQTRDIPVGIGHRDPARSPCPGGVLRLSLLRLCFFHLRRFPRGPVPRQCANRIGQNLRRKTQRAHRRVMAQRHRHPIAAPRQRFRGQPVHQSALPDHRIQHHRTALQRPLRQRPARKIGHRLQLLGVPHRNQLAPHRQNLPLKPRPLPGPHHARLVHDEHERPPGHLPL